MIVLDTDIVTLMQHRLSVIPSRLLARIDRAEPREPVVTTLVTYEEQMRGWMQVIKAADSVKEQISAYRRLRSHIDFFNCHRMLDLDAPAAVEFQRLRRLKVRIGTMDLRIAAIAMANAARLWSRNLRDFRQVPGLMVEDPLADATA